jgi:hypothetical protein
MVKKFFTPPLNPPKWGPIFCTVRNFQYFSNRLDEIFRLAELSILALLLTHFDAFS